MNYFMKQENVDTYKQMLVDYDSSWLTSILEDYLKPGSTLLEIGMGTGLDLDILSKKYKVTGSDNSPIFVDEYNFNHTHKALLIDATNIKIESKFDCIYSNKVLQHLTKEQFISSLHSQKSHLNHEGIIFLTLWYGVYEEQIMFDGQLRFIYYTEIDIIDIVKDHFNVVDIRKYTESDPMDSLLVVLKAK